MLTLTKNFISRSTKCFMKLKRVKLINKCTNLTFNLRDSNIIDLYDALSILRIQTQCEEGAREVNNIRVPKIRYMRLFYSIQ